MNANNLSVLHLCLQVGCYIASAQEFLVVVDEARMLQL